VSRQPAQLIVQSQRRDIKPGHRTRLRGSIKKLRTALSGGNPKDSAALLPTTVSEIDKACKRGVLHRNTAARHKSRLTVRVNQAQQK